MGIHMLVLEILVYFVFHSNNSKNLHDFS